MYRKKSKKHLKIFPYGFLVIISLVSAVAFCFCRFQVLAKQMDETDSNNMAYSALNVEIVDQNGENISFGKVNNSGSSISNAYLKLTNGNSWDANVSLQGTSENGDIAFSFSESSFTIASGQSKTVQINYSLNTSEAYNYTSNLKIDVEYSYAEILDGSTGQPQIFTKPAYFMVYKEGSIQLKTGMLRAKKGSNYNCLYMDVEEKITSLPFKASLSSSFQQYDQDDNPTDQGVETGQDSKLVYTADIYMNKDVVTTLQDLGFVFKLRYNCSDDYRRIEVGDDLKLKIDDNAEVSGDQWSVSSEGFTVSTDLEKDWDDNGNEGIRWSNQDEATVNFSGNVASIDSDTINILATIPVSAWHNPTISWLKKGSTSGEFQINITVRTYTSNDIKNIEDIVHEIQRNNFADHFSSNGSIISYDDYLKQAYALLANKNISTSMLEEAGAALSDSFNSLENNVFEDKNVIAVNHYKKTGDLNSETEESVKEYIVYETGTSFELPYYGEYDLATNKKSAVISGTASENLELSYTYWNIDYSELEDLINDSQSYLSETDKYTQSSLNNLSNIMNIYAIYTEEDGFAPSSQNDVNIAIAVINNAINSLELRKYPVTFKNEDGSILQSIEFAYGSIPTYNGETPTKAGNAQYSYSFAGWDQAITAVTGDQAYTAVYSEILNQYTITWKNDDGTILETDTDVPYGATPVYNGATPEKASTDEYDYSFDKWSPDIAPVTGDTTYTATFSLTTRTYTITWKNDDGTILETDTDVPYGSTPVYDGATPEKASTVQYSYSFNGWSPSIDTVTGDKTYTAAYLETLNQYTIIFVNYDGTELDRQTLDYGIIPFYKKILPTRASTSELTYTFAGWSEKIGPVIGNKTYVAVFTEIPIEKDDNQDEDPEEPEEPSEEPADIPDTSTDEEEDETPYSEPEGEENVPESEISPNTGSSSNLKDKDNYAEIAISILPLFLIAIGIITLRTRKN